MTDSLEKITAWKKAGKRIVFTNGVFDILHAGHVDYLQAASEMGDKLIVGLNSDDSVRRLNKSPERPVNPSQARKKVLEALRFVDMVFVFEENTPIQLIERVQPDVLVKGGDYDPQITDPGDPAYIVGSDLVSGRGGKVIAIPLTPGFSTTAIIDRLKG